ncbi:hypothetical protein KJ641_01485 [Patescibacteria group bacterium]|nr:hypothetical protein [Patescibacteria group bacterium]
MKQIKNRKLNRWQGYDYSQLGWYYITICTKNHENCFGYIKNGIMCVNRFGSIVNWQWKWLSQQYPYIRLDAFIVMPDHVHGIIVIDGSSNVPDDCINITNANNISLTRRNDIVDDINGDNTITVGTGRDLSPVHNNVNNDPGSHNNPSPVHNNVNNDPGSHNNPSPVHNNVNNDTVIYRDDLIDVKNDDNTIVDVRTRRNDIVDDINGDNTITVGTGRDLFQHDEIQRDDPPTKIKSISELIGAFKTTSSKLIHQNGSISFVWQRSFYDHIIRDQKSYYNIRRYIIHNPELWWRDRNNL